jgi:dipeptidyl aminopeptidase/acylaminoacyl peptidase
MIPIHSWMIRCLLVIFLWVSGSCGFAHSQEEKVFHTGLEAKRSELTVSPDGKFVLFTADTKGLNLLDVANGVIRAVPDEAGRTLDYPDWSPDGRRVAAVSAIHDGSGYRDMKIVLLDPGNWTSHRITSGKGRKFSPFFSRDGETVYYFKGDGRQKGRPESYDLYAIDIRSGREERMTSDTIYQKTKGDDDGKTILFCALGPGRFSKKVVLDEIGEIGQLAPYLLEKSTKIIVPLPIDRGGEFANFYITQRDESNHAYFIASKWELPANLRFFLNRIDKVGKNLVELSELPMLMSFDIARETGEIFVTDLQGPLLTIRRLSIRASH